MRVFGNTEVRNVLYLLLKRKSNSRLEKMSQGAAASFTPLTIRITVIRCGRIKRKGHVTSMGEMKNVCRFWRENLKKKAILKTLMEYIKTYLKGRR
jgi:hypothetical protein